MIGAGEVRTVIVKDMSRLGRNYLQVGITDIVFVGNNVWLVSSNDNVDATVSGLCRPWPHIGRKSGGDHPPIVDKHIF